MEATRLQVGAVVRVDKFQPEDVAVQNRVTVREIVRSQEEARAEVDRLNRLNSGKGAFYFWQATRLIKAKGSAAPDVHT